MTNQLMLMPEQTQAQALPLRDYQQEAIRAANDAYEMGDERALIAVPTGAGKTVIAAHLIHSRHGTYPGKAVFLVHRDELVAQSVDKIRRVDPRVSIGVVKAERDELDAEIIVASVQTLARPRRRSRLLKALHRAGGLHTLIVDEAHHSGARSWAEVIDSLAPRGSGILSVGFTATPERSDGVGLDTVWDVIAYRKDILWMIQQGYLCDVRGEILEIAKLDLAAVKKSGRDYQDGDLGRAILAAGGPERVLEGYLRHGEGRKFLGFAPTVAAAHEFAEIFRRHGINVGEVYGQTDDGERRRTLAAFHDGQVRGVWGVGVLTEGYDEPSVECILMARPTKSHSLYVQIVGRGLRPFPGKKDLLVLDVVGASDQHKLVMVAKLAGKAPGGTDVKPKHGETLTQALERTREEEERAEAVKGKLIRRKAELFQQAAGAKGQNEAKKSLFAWAALAPDKAGLNLGNSWICVKQELSGWTAIHRDAAGNSQRIGDFSPDINTAKRFAETFVLANKPDAMKLVNPRSRWRQEPATHGQLWRLRQSGYPTHDGMTKGQATDALDTIKLKEVWG